MSIYCNHKQAVRDCFKASFCISVMCLILQNTSAEHTFVAPCIPSCGLSSAYVPGSGESYAIAMSMAFSAASTSIWPRIARDIALPVTILSTSLLA